MPETCVHGLPASECLICQTLGTGAPARTKTRTQVSSRPPSVSGGAELEQGRGRDPERHGRRHVAVEVVAILVGLVVVLLVGALLFEAVRAIVHLIELIVVALGAGWIGFRFGRLRGRDGSA